MATLVPRAREVRLPRSLLYPVEITSLSIKLGDSVKRHAQLLHYKYWNKVPDGVPDDNAGDQEPEMVTKEFYAVFESPHDGVVEDLLMQPGDRINDHTAVIMRIAEPCDHSVQYDGLCALCGLPLDTADYLDYTDADRAPIAMSHDTSGLTVSRAEAERLETMQNERLIRDKKLILVVDLDQTVIHAAVDPRVGEWISDEDSPNHHAVKDVKSFILRERCPDGTTSSCPYYIKLRPGLAEFLEKMSQLFEMHIYTMATKVYAREVAKLIDPEGKYFGDRILSREESGSLIQKDIARLFPITTSLVTIIDDRGDVWNWSKHLIRVFPYNFFAGTGDINSSFLPQRNGLVVPAAGSDPADPNAPVVVEDNLDDDTDNKSKFNSSRQELKGTTQGMRHDQDHELKNLEPILTKVHHLFYEAFEKSLAMPKSALKADMIPDAGSLMNAERYKVFGGCVFLFSGIFPVGTPPEKADLVQWVRTFGAVVLTEYRSTVTHVIADSGGTLKARQGAGGGAHVVSTRWIFACLEHWIRVSETPYLIKVRDPVKPALENDERVRAGTKRGRDYYESGSADANGRELNGQSNGGVDLAEPTNNTENDNANSDSPEGEEPEQETANNFVRSLSRGDFDWDVDEELREMMVTDSDDDSESKEMETDVAIVDDKANEVAITDDSESIRAADVQAAKDVGDEHLSDGSDNAKLVLDDSDDFAAELEAALNSD